MNKLFHLQAKYPAVLLLFLLLFPVTLVMPPAVSGFVYQGTEFAMGLRWIANTHDETASGPSPLLPSFSAGFPFTLAAGGTLFFIPSLSLQGTNYLYDEDAGRAAPAEIEHRELYVLLPLLDFSLRWNFLIREEWKLGVESGMGFLLPVPIVPEDKDRAGKIISWLYEEGRFFYPSLGVRYERSVTERFAWSLGLRTGIPVMNLNDDENPFHDRITVNFGVGLSFLPRRDLPVKELPQGDFSEGDLPEEDLPQVDLSEREEAASE